MSNQIYLEQNRKNMRIVRNVSMVTLIANIVLTVIKMTAGGIFSNTAVISDGVNSLFDVGTTLIILFAVFVSKPHEDKSHNYGHEKIEPLFVLFFALILGGVGILLFVQGIMGIISPKEVTLNYFLVAATVVSIVFKEIMYWYTRHYAKKTKSNALKADAWNHRSDTLSSAAVLLGFVCGIFIKTDLVESIAVLFVSALIIKVAVQILTVSINQLIDRAADESVCEELKAMVLEIDEVESIDKFQTRLFGSALFVDVEIGVKGELSVYDSHGIAQAVHDKLEAQQKYPIKHCNVHVNPVNKT